MRPGQLPYCGSQLPSRPLACRDPAVLTSAGSWSLGASLDASTSGKCWTSREASGAHPAPFLAVSWVQKSWMSNPRTRRDLSFQLIQLIQDVTCISHSGSPGRGCHALRVTSGFWGSLAPQEKGFSPPFESGCSPRCPIAFVLFQ